MIADLKHVRLLSHYAEQFDSSSGASDGAVASPQRFNPYRFVLDCGKIFYPRIGHPKMTKQHCYWNAGRKIVYRGLEYVEGFDLHVGFPISHAWNVDKKGAVDFTPRPNDQSGYVGVIIPIEAYLAVVRAHQRWDSVLMFLAYDASDELRQKVVTEIVSANLEMTASDDGSSVAS